MHAKRNNFSRHDDISVNKATIQSSKTVCFTPTFCNGEQGLMNKILTSISNIAFELCILT